MSDRKTQPLEVTLLIPVIAQVAATVEDFNTAAGSPTACLDNANAKVIYGRPAGEQRDRLLSHIESDTGIEREYKQEEGKEKVYTENEKKYFNRVLDELGLSVEQGRARWSATAQAIADTIDWFPRPSSRGKIGQEWLDQAAKIAAVVGDDDAIFARLQSSLGSTGVTLTRLDDGTVNLETLALAVKLNTQRLQAEAANNLLAGI